MKKIFALVSAVLILTILLAEGRTCQPGTQAPATTAGATATPTAITTARRLPRDHHHSPPV